MFIPGNLKTARKEKKLFHTDVLYRLHEQGIKISRQTLINWESGYTTPNANEVQILAGILGRPIDFFFDDTEYLSGKENKAHIS